MMKMMKPEIINNVGRNGKVMPESINGIDIDVRITQPAISVIIPVYQEEKLLDRTLNIFTEDLKKKYNLEVIVSDGGSTDKTVEIAGKYADQVVRHTEDRRQTISEGRNKGAEAATGNILLFLNGDCQPEDPDSFFNYVLEWSEGKNALSGRDALACPVSVAPDEIIFKDKIFYACHNSYVRFLNSIGMGMGRGECQIVRRDAFVKVGGYNSLIAAGEDFDLYRRLAKVTRIGFANEIKVYESPRRFRKYGYLRILWAWTLNSLSVMLKGKSVSDEWEAVR